MPKRKRSKEEIQRRLKELEEYRQAHPNPIEQMRRDSEAEWREKDPTAIAVYLPEFIGPMIVHQYEEKGYVMVDEDLIGFMDDDEPTSGIAVFVKAKKEE